MFPPFLSAKEWRKIESIMIYLSGRGRAGYFITTTTPITTTTAAAAAAAAATLLLQQQLLLLQIKTISKIATTTTIQGSRHPSRPGRASQLLMGGHALLKRCLLKSLHFEKVVIRMGPAPPTRLRGMRRVSEAATSPRALRFYTFNYCCAHSITAYIVFYRLAHPVTNCTLSSIMLYK
jgi:hypothetical protein